MRSRYRAHAFAVYLLLHMLGGLALLVLGIRFLRKGLDRLLGDRLPVVIARATRGPFQATGTGILIGVVGPSSTALSLVSISLVQDRDVPLKRAMSFLLGAYVGATIMVQIIALSISDEAPILVLAGVALFLGATRRVTRGIGQVFLALGIIFLGVGIMQEDAARIAGHEDLGELLELASRYPWLLALLGLLLTMMLQSSTATIAALLSLGAGQSAMIGMEVALPAVAGANVGIAATALIAGWRRVESRRLALGVLLCRGAVAVVVLTLGAWSLGLIAYLPGELPRQIAHVHTAFNLLVVVACFPLLGAVAWLVERLIPPGPIERTTSDVMRLDPRWANEPTVAFAQTRRQIGMMTQLVRGMLGDAWDALESGDASLIRGIREQDDLVDLVDRDVKLFLTQELTGELTNRQTQMRIDQLRFATDLERIADLIERDLIGIARKKQATGLRFSDEGWGEIKDLFDEVQEALALAEAAFVENDAELASKLLAQKERIRDTELALRKAHYERLHLGRPETLETTEMHLEAIGILKTIGHLAASVAHSVLGTGDETAERDASDHRGS